MSRRSDHLPLWPAAALATAGVALLALGRALGRALARFVDDAIVEVDYS